jgi:tetratricopeptide (TPR) repeat protein
MLRLREKIFLIFFGLAICMVILEVGLRLGGWVFISLQQYRNEKVIREGGTYRILCLGESTTAHRRNCYPSQLQQMLNKSNVGVKFVVINEGVRGITTKDILKRLPDHLNKYRPDMVIAMMGINDRKGFLPYEDIALPEPLHVLREFKVYKLVTLLWVHCARKLEELQERKLFLAEHSMTVKFKKEEERLQRAIAINPGDNKAYLALGGYYLDSARFLEAEEMFKKAIMADAGDDAAYFKLGKCYAETGRFKESEELFQKALGINPRNYEAYRKLGLYYLSEGRLQEIEEMLKRVIERAPGDDRAYSLLGWYYIYVGRNQEAEDILKRAIELNPENYKAISTLGLHYIKRGEYPKAQETYDKLVAVRPENDEAYVVMAEGYHDAGRIPEAEELLQRAIVLYPQKIDAYASLARNYRKMGRTKEGENVLKRAIAINPESREAYFALGKFYIDTGRWSEARRTLREALKQNPGYYEIYKQFASYYKLGGGAFQEAEEIFRKALEINPRDYELSLELGSCYETRGKPGEAEDVFVKAIAINPKQSCAYYKLGCLYEGTTRFQEAQRVWTKGLEVTPGNYEIRAKLVRLYREQGKSRDAEVLLQGPIGASLRYYAIYLGLDDFYKSGLLPQPGSGSEASRKQYDHTTNKSEPYYSESTKHNFRKLREILEQKKIKLVIMQYPCRRLEPLKNIFEDKRGVIFVDNETVFKAALGKGHYDEYFIDRFGDDFGHCTKRGNQLLAENVANVILKNIGSRK